MPVPGRPAASQVVVQMLHDSGYPGQTAGGCLAGGSLLHRVVGGGVKGGLAGGPDLLALTGDAGVCVVLTGL